MTEPLTLDDILDLRAYERVRDEVRAGVIAQKKLRRIPLGPIMTAVFESADTVRFQIQEMARVEKIASDEGILSELAVYNRLLPGNGELSATLFIELTSESELRDWLPRLVGVEGSLGSACPTARWRPAGRRNRTRPPSPGRRSLRPSTTCGSPSLPPRWGI
jgi:hypothetical protein